MAELRIQLPDNRTRFTPDDTINGIAGWSVDEAKSATIRLFWRTEGKGTQDLRLEAEMSFDGPRPTDERKFAFVVPAGPWSYDGKLIAIVWALELVLEPGGKVESLDILVSPDREVPEP